MNLISKPHRFSVIAAMVISALVTIFVFWPAVHNSFVNWDDPFYLSNVSELKHVSPASLKWLFIALTVYYQPLTWLSHLIDFQIWGWNLSGHHATSVMLHAINASLVCLFIWLLASTVESLSAGARLLVATGVALFFGVHPLQVESVAWIAERKTILCSLFSLMSLCAYLVAVSQSNRRHWWNAMAVLFVAALLSKPMALSLPFVLLAIDFYPLRRHRSCRWTQLLNEKWFLFLCSAIVAGLTVFAQARTGAITGLAGFGILDRILVASRNVAFYMWKLIWPGWLSPYYPLEGEIRPGDFEFFSSIIAVVAITGLAFWQRAHWPVVWSAWCAYLALIAPVSGLVQAGPQGAGDRFMYFAMIPLLALAAAAAVWLWRQFHLILRSALMGLLGLYMVFDAVRTRDQIPVWRDDLTLWMTAADYFPNSALINFRLASALTDQHRYDAAQIYAEKALRLNPTYGLAHVALGEIYLKTQRYDSALKEAEAGMRADPNLPIAQYLLACAEAELGQLPQAFDALEKLLFRSPEFAAWASDSEELAVLRKNPAYAARFSTLIQAARHRQAL